MDSSERKFSYTPTTKRRFEISNDTYSRERLRGLLETYRQLKEEIPFFAGMMLHGSLSKGKQLTAENAPHTDVDLLAYMDNEKYEELITEFENSNPAFKEFAEWAIAKHPRVLAGHSRTQDDVRPDNLEHATEMWIQKRIENILANNSSSGDLLHSGKVSVELRSISMDHKSVYSIFATITRFEEFLEVHELEEEDFAHEFYYHIAAFFKFDIGNGLAPYRRAFMKHMLTLSEEEREKHWGIVVRAMKYWERNNDIPPELAHAYPETFEDAMKYYLPSARANVE